MVEATIKCDEILNGVIPHGSVTLFTLSTNKITS